jgi:uncharacterized protein with GYD domain
MAKYISLVKYTAEGVENVKESPDRLDAFKQLCESMGAKVEGFYLTMGRYDLVVIVDAPTPEAVSKKHFQLFQRKNIGKSSPNYHSPG